MNEAHARLGPSNHRWPNCPGSVREEAAYPDIPGEAAIDGTGSHLLLELCLQNGACAEAYDGQIIGVNHVDNSGGWLVGIERIERVQMCLDYITRRVNELKGIYPASNISVEAESKSDPGGMFGRDDWWGTVDITITVLGELGSCLFIEVIDYKDGRGWVHVPGNTQLISYLAGKLRPHIAAGTHIKWVDAIPHCRVTIVQPKTNPVIRYEDVSSAQIATEAIKLAEAANKTDDPNAPLIPDDKNGNGYCRWCKHKPNCAALTDRSLTQVKSMTNEIIATDGQSLFELLAASVDRITELPSEQLADLADTKAGMDAIYKKINNEIEARLNRDEEVPGYEWGNSKGQRVWNKPEEEIAKMLKARKFKKGDIYPAKLISAPQVLGSKLLDEKQKERIEKEYVTFDAGKKTVKKVARKKHEQTVEQMFGDVVQSDDSYPSLFDEIPATEQQDQSTKISFF